MSTSLFSAGGILLAAIVGGFVGAWAVRSLRGTRYAAYPAPEPLSRGTLRVQQDLSLCERGHCHSKMAIVAALARYLAAVSLEPDVRID